MATAITYNTAKSKVISLLQASRTAYATTTDGAKRQFASDTEIFDAILAADGEVCHIIISTLNHPYQNGFVTTSSALTSGSKLPAHNGMVVRVTCLNGQTAVNLTGVNFVSNILSVSGGHGFTQGQKVRLTTSGALPTGYSLATDYYVIYLSSTTFRLAATPYDAATANPVTISDAGTGTHTVTPQYIEAFQGKSADEVKEMSVFGGVYQNDTSTNNSLLNYWFIEGDILYHSALYAKADYTDYTLTSNPQAPEPYLNAVVAGAVATLLKDGGDSEQAAYYLQQFMTAKQQIAAGAA